MVEMSKHSMRMGGASSAKCALQLQQRIVDALVLVVRAHLVAHERVLRVASQPCQQAPPSRPFCGAVKRTLAPCALASFSVSHFSIDLFVLGQLPQR